MENKRLEKEKRQKLIDEEGIEMEDFSLKRRRREQLRNYKPKKLRDFVESNHK